MAAEYFVAALVEDYLAAERARRVPTEVATQPGVTLAEEVEATKSPEVKQQQLRPLHQPDSSSSSSDEGLGGDTQSGCRGGVGNVEW